MRSNLEDAITDTDRNIKLLLSRPFTHPGDRHLTMVLCLVGSVPETAEYVTWYFNSDSGGFGEGHYFHVANDPDAEILAHLDFWERCKRYCSLRNAAKE